MLHSLGMLISLKAEKNNTILLCVSSKNGIIPSLSNTSFQTFFPNWKVINNWTDLTTFKLADGFGFQRPFVSGCLSFCLQNIFYKAFNAIEKLVNCLK